LAKKPRQGQGRQAAGGGVFQQPVKDEKNAFRWFSSATSNGHYSAPVALVECHLLGRGTEKDIAEAFRLCVEFAERGNEIAQTRLGRMYLDGVGVPRDYVFSYAWLNIAAAAGEDSAMEWRDNLEEKMTKTQIAEAQRLASRWEVGTSISR